MQCLENRSETILCHDCQLQDMLSAVCERHCVYYLCQRARGLSYEKVLALYHDDVLKNDVLLSDVINAVIGRQHHVCSLQMLRDCYCL